MSFQVAFLQSTGQQTNVATTHVAPERMRSIKMVFHHLEFMGIVGVCWSRVSFRLASHEHVRNDVYCIHVYIYIYVCLYIYRHIHIQDILDTFRLFQPVSSISVTPSVNVVPYVVLNVLKISLCKKPCCS